MLPSANLPARASVAPRSPSANTWPKVTGTLLWAAVDVLVKLTSVTWRPTPTGVAAAAAAAAVAAEVAMPNGVSDSCTGVRASPAPSSGAAPPPQALRAATHKRDSNILVDRERSKPFMVIRYIQEEFD